MGPLLLLSSLALLSLPGPGSAARKCGYREDCVARESCQDYRQGVQELKQLGRGTPERKELLEELKESVCDKTKGSESVCCERDPKQGRACLTSGGELGSCQSSCSGATTYSSSCGNNDLSCCGRAAPEEATVDVRGWFERPEPALPGGLCGLDDTPTDYVWNGKEARQGELPFMASLVWTSRRSRRVTSFCGGVLITSKHILTAAHCFKTVTARDWQNKAVDVRIGLTDLNSREIRGNRANIKSVKIHENFKRQGVGVVDDIAIVTLDRDVQEGTVCLPTEYQSYTNKSAVIAGWGRTNQGTYGQSVQKLRYATLKEISIRDCQKKYNSFLAGNRKKANLSQKQLCAGNAETDACAGDSGGPLLHINRGGVWMVSGIVSFGPSSCGQQVPGVYTRVASYLAWIKENTGQ